MLILNEEQSKKFKKAMGTEDSSQESEEDGIRAEYIRRLRTLRLRKAPEEEIQRLTELFKGYLNEME